MPRMIWSKDIVEILFRCQSLLDDKIIKNLKHTQGHGHILPSVTIKTWEVVKERLDALYYQWAHAVKPTHLSSLTSSSACKDMADDLEELLEWAVEQQSQTMDNIHIGAERNGKTGRKDARDRGKDMLEFRKRNLNEGWNDACDVQAYKRLCELGRYTEQRGWTSEKYRPSIVNEKDLKDREKAFKDHMHKVRMDLECGYTRTLYRWDS